MKNIFKSRFSLIAICIVLGILIGSFALCGCRMNHSLLEGMEPSTETEEEKKKKQIESLQPSLSPADYASSLSTPVGVGDVASGLSNIGANLEAGGDGNAITSSIAKALQTINPVEKITSSISGGGASSASATEGFQNSRPLGWKPLADDESDEVNLSSWVSSAVKYAKGMGTEDRLNSLQYNSGPPIPLPEDQLFFFKDTKFNPSCCPSTYTSSIGCACMSKKQFQYLTQRGGNHTAPNNRTSYFNEF
jgi:hypothetical protein